MRKKNIVFAFMLGLFLPAYNTTAQETFTTDPLLKFKHFYEIGISANATRVNTNHTVFNTPSGQYNFQKNNFLPGIDGNINFGWLFKDKESNLIWTLKTGVNILGRSADLTDANGASLRLTTSYLQIPLQLGFRFPMRYNTVKNDLYRAIEVNAGVYAAMPTMQKLDHPDNIDSRTSSLPLNYLKFGFIGEIVFTALNSQGHGHRFGMRATNDFAAIAKFKETPNQLYPYYVTVGFFYNLSNNYK